MKLRINHLTVYNYDNEVYLGIHLLYLLPQNRLYFDVVEKEMLVSPTPDGMSERMDFSGNFFSQLWFSKPSRKLEIKSSMTVQLKSFNPFDFILDFEFVQAISANSQVLFHYSEEEKALVEPYISASGPDEMRKLVGEFWKGQEDILGFLMQVTAHIHQNWEHIIRYEQDLWSPDYTFQVKKGSCRDLAWMQMNMLGKIGLACRFVSGYAFNPELNEGHELHAWLEVYLPGAGWVGLDPSLGLLTNHQYIPLAAHANPRLTNPVQGNFAGIGGSNLYTKVEISQLSSQEQNQSA